MVWRDSVSRVPVVVVPGFDPEHAPLERRRLGGARSALREAVWWESSPTRVVRLGSRTLDLTAALPGMRVREGSLSSAAGWARWPDVVWSDCLLSSSELPLEATLDALAAAVPEGSLAAVIELHPDTPPALARAIGLRAPGPVLPGLRARFCPLYEATLADRDGFRAAVFLGRRPAVKNGRA